jgi:hypothetical protein
MKMEDIERYINGEMEVDERRDFESKLQNDIQLQEEVNRVSLLISNLKHIGLSNKIKQVQNNNRYTNKLIQISVVGIILVILGLLYFLYQKTTDKIAPTVPQNFNTTPDSIQNQKNINLDTSPPTNIEPIQREGKPEKSEQPIASNAHPVKRLNYEEIAMEFYFEPMEMAYLRGEDIVAPMDSVKFLYNNEEFGKALTILNKLTPDREVDYFKAHVYFRMAQYSKSNQFYLNTLAREINIEKKEHIEWYLLLNQLACGISCKVQFDENLLRILNNKNHKHYIDATKLKLKLA